MTIFYIIDKNKILRKEEFFMKTTGIVRDDRYMNHDTGAYHVESAKRLEVIYEMVDANDMKDKFKLIPARFATKEEILWIHEPHYYERIESTKGKPARRLDFDTVASPESFDVALLAVGGLLNLVDSVTEGKIDNGFALIRPPGHHAERDRSAGFCIFNNIAIAAEYLKKRKDMKKVLIVDWDLHHGNGTQHSFFDDNSILYFSTHQSPFYPGTGNIKEIGYDEAKGFTVNVPLSPGCSNEDFFRIYEEILVPIAKQFSPDFILVSAGFDIYYQDPLGGMQVTEEGFAGLTRILMDLANEVCNGKLAITLEGGYNLEGLKNSVKAVLNELAEIDVKGKKELEKKRGNKNRFVDDIIKRVKDVQKEFWSIN